MHLRTIWRGGAAANGRRCICLEHLPPQVLLLFEPNLPTVALVLHPSQNTKLHRAKPSLHRLLCLQTIRCVRRKESAAQQQIPGLEVQGWHLHGSRVEDDEQ